jgi:iron complex transport system ATP-binding protein
MPSKHQVARSTRAAHTTFFFATMPSPVIDIRALSLGTESGLKILRGIDWTVLPGEHWVVLGPNGSGKTTLLSAITGYLHETTAIPAGKLTVLGQTYGESDWRELRKRVGIVGASIRNRIPEEKTALGTVAGGKDALLFIWEDLTKAELREARRLLKLTECAELEDRAWAVLSQGERQRVLIARALMAKPKLLILDEPCAGLDPVARENFLGFVERLARTPDAPTLVLVTHHVEEITPCFTHALCIRDGVTISGGEKSAILTNKSMRATFGEVVTLSVKAGRYTLSVKPNPGVAV